MFQDFNSFFCISWHCEITWWLFTWFRVTKIHNNKLVITSLKIFLVDISVTCLFWNGFLRNKISLLVSQYQIVSILIKLWTTWRWNSCRESIKGKENILLSDERNRINPWLFFSSLIKWTSFPILMVISDIKILKCFFEFFDWHEEAVLKILLICLRSVIWVPFYVLIVPWACIFFCSYWISKLNELLDNRASFLKF